MHLFDPLPPPMPPDAPFERPPHAHPWLRVIREGFLLVVIPITIKALLMGTGLLDAALLIFGIPVTIFIGLAMRYFVSRRPRRLARWALCSAVFTITAILFVLYGEDPVRDYGRWWLAAPYYKARIAQVGERDCGPLHMEWDMFGWGGSSTITYLVYDPDGKKPLPPGYVDERRLEHDWRLVIYGDDASWECLTPPLFAK